MAQIHVIGRITADLELKHSQGNTPYVRFDLAENIGRGDRARVQYYQVWAWGEHATRLIGANARKGSLLHIIGSLELEEFARQDGHTKDKRMKVMLNNWEFIQISSSGSHKALQTSIAPEPSPPTYGELNGDREALPG